MKIIDCMKVLIAGANGITGHHVIKHLMDSGHTAMAMIRDKHEAASLHKMGAQTIVADLGQDISHAFEGIDAVIFTAGAGADSSEHATNMVDRDGAIKMIHEAEKHKVGKFVMLSAIGAGQPDQADEAMAIYMQAKADADKALKRSSLNFSIVRAGKLTNDGGTRAIAINQGLISESGDIPREDVALVLIACLDDPRASRKVFGLVEGKDTVDEAFDKLVKN